MGTYSNTKGHSGDYKPDYKPPFIKPSGPGGWQSYVNQGKCTFTYITKAQQKLLEAIKKYAFDEEISDKEFREFIQNALHSHVID